jgi:hypothetical protein
VSKASKPPKLDSVGAEAVDAARAALIDLVPAGDVGAYLGHEAEDKKVVTHYFSGLALVGDRRPRTQAEDRHDRRGRAAAR